MSPKLINQSIDRTSFIRCNCVRWRNAISAEKEILTERQITIHHDLLRLAFKLNIPQRCISIVGDEFDPNMTSRIEPILFIVENFIGPCFPGSIARFGTIHCEICDDLDKGLIDIKECTNWKRGGCEYLCCVKCRNDAGWCWLCTSYDDDYKPANRREELLQACYEDVDDRYVEPPGDFDYHPQSDYKLLSPQYHLFPFCFSRIPMSGQLLSEDFEEVD